MEIKNVKEIKCPKCNSVLTGWEEMSNLVCSDEVISTWAGDCKKCDKSYGFKVHYPIKNYEILNR